MTFAPHIDLKSYQNTWLCLEFSGCKHHTLVHLGNVHISPAFLNTDNTSLPTFELKGSNLWNSSLHLAQPIKVKHSNNNR